MKIKEIIIISLLLMLAVAAVLVIIFSFGGKEASAPAETQPEVSVQPLPDKPEPEKPAEVSPPQEEQVEEPQPEQSPEPVESTPEEKYSPLYCTVWPTKELELYDAPDGENVIGTVAPCTMLCVMAEYKDAELFEVLLAPDSRGWLDSRYCLINLPEYIGDLCSYCITNSFDSRYTIHEYEIPGLTGKQIKGYENIRLADGSFVVPFLYPCTGKLIAAAEKALEKGYRIKIYDSYRPQVATGEIYRVASGIMDNPLPAYTATGHRVILPKLPIEKEGEEERNHLIYLDLIEQDGWSLGAFLAPGSSRHNMGVAVDMTFEDAVTGEELAAQSVMHDLSAYSTIYSNNAIAAEMYYMLEGCGLHNIVSEWWHFQDNEAINALKPPYCEKGVSPEGWMYDGAGLKYRRADGTCVTDSLLVLETGQYLFDAEGYLVR